MLPLVFTVRIDYWDGFDYLVNAKCLAGASSDFAVIRPVLLPLLLMPVQWIGRLTGDWELTLVLSHAMVLILNCGFVYAAMRLIAPRTWWGFAIGLLLLCVNVLFIDYAIFTLSDFLSACCFVLAWLAWEDWLAESSRRAFSRFIVWNGIGLLSKHTFPALWVTFPLGAFFTRGSRLNAFDKESLLSIRHRAAAFCLMLIVSVFVAVFTIWWGGHNAGITTVKLPTDAGVADKAIGLLLEFVVAAENLLARYAGQFLFNVGPGKFPREYTGGATIDANKLLYVQSYLIALGPPALVFACAEGIRSFLAPPSRNRARAVTVLWTFLFFSLLVNHKEVRYVTFVLPFVIALCVDFAERMIQKVNEVMHGPFHLCITILLIAAIIAVPCVKGLNEWYRILASPVFHRHPLHGLTREVYRKHKGFYILEPNRSSIPDLNHARFVVGWGSLSYFEAKLH